jgi:uncharacterized protein YdcH (DUF465 family)
MDGEHHDLAHEFPEYKEEIHTLKMSDNHFARLFEKYHKIDREVRRMETNIEPVADSVLEGEKLIRLKLKDELYAMLKKHSAK